VYSKEGSIPTHLLLLIIIDLRKVASQLTKGLHFSFQIKSENWNIIPKYISINAFYSNPYIFTTLKFPIIVYPTYKIIRAIYLFFFLILECIYFREDHPLIVLENNENNRFYESDLDICMRDTTMYTCEQTFPIYYVKFEAPCKVLIFINASEQFQNCENGHVLFSTTP